MRRAREGSEISLAFLDVICCGFGAIILLLMITKENLPTILEPSLEEVVAELARRQEAINEILGITEELKRAKVETEADLEIEVQKLAELLDELEELTSEFENLRELTVEQQATLADLREARQQLTEEQIALLGDNYVRKDDTIGGIPVDSEYVIFVIDTSPSMQIIWGSVVKKFEEVLNIYPVVKGIQVLNDNGHHMFTRSPGEWLRDTPSRRKTIKTVMRSWKAQSNSSPVEGVTKAIETYYDPKKQISIYVFGDDFMGRSVESVVDYIDSINVADKDGNRKVRIHAIGFPGYMDNGRPLPNLYLLSSLMRELTVRNNGTFVGLPRL
ncbi:MAG: VWA domain-containing protein [Gammaproteobacteria bacterium]|nr:VWA domain-containing protein [Gammaproteobacteria bacterium]